MYERMLKEIDRYRWDSGFCRRVLSTAIVAYRPLRLTEIGHLSGLPEQILKSTENVRKIVAKCGSFLTVQDDQIYLVHQSAKDYLSTSNLLFLCGAEIAHHDMFIRSLDLMSDKLRRNMYSLKAPGFPIDEVQTPSPDPLVKVRYSCVFWVDHLRDSISDKDMPQCNALDVVQTFLERKYLYWLEALSLLRAMSEGIIAIRQLEGLLVSLYHRTPESKSNRDIGTRRSRPSNSINSGCTPVCSVLQMHSRASPSSSVRISPYICTNR